MTFLKVGGSLQSNSKVSSASLACQGSLEVEGVFFWSFLFTNCAWSIQSSLQAAENVHKVGVLSEI